MPGIETPSPYAEDTQDLNGRLAFQVVPKNWYNIATNQPAGGSDRTIPYPREIACGEEGDIWVMYRDPVTNAVVPRCHSKTIKDRMDELEAAGIFENAMAFVYNRQIYKLFFDNTRQTVRAGEDLEFEANHRYYAIRGYDLVDGHPDYHTGVSGITGSDIISNLVDMEVRMDVDGNPFTVFSTGHLIKPLVHTASYVVEFYDADRVLLRTLTFQAVSLRYLSFNVAPDMAVEDLIPMFNYPMEGDPFKCKLHQGQSWQDIGLRVFLKIAGDGHAKDVTQEQFIGQRLIVEDIENIDSTELTADDGVPQTFNITYFLSQAATSNPLVDPVTLSLTRQVQVYIVPDVADVPYKLIPVIWKNQNDSTLILRFFAMYQVGTISIKGSLRDITSLLKNVTIPNFTYDANSRCFVDNGSQNGQTVNFTVTVPYGLSSQSTFTVNFLADLNVNQKKVAVSVGAGITPVIRTMAGTTVGNEKFLRFVGSGATGDTVANLTQEFRFTVGSVVVNPTHFQIRDARDPDFKYTGLIPIGNANTPFLAVDDQLHNLYYNGLRDTALVAEFFNVVTGPMNEIVERVATGSATFFATTV